MHFLFPGAGIAILTLSKQFAGNIVAQSHRVTFASSSIYVQFNGLCVRLDFLMSHAWVALLIQDICAGVVALCVWAAVVAGAGGGVFKICSETVCAQLSAHLVSHSLAVVA